MEKHASTVNSRNANQKMQTRRLLHLKSPKNHNKINFAIKQTDRGLKTETN